MIANVRIGQSLMTFEGSPEGITKVLENHIVRALRAQSRSIDISIEVPITGQSIIVTDDGELDEITLARTPIGDA